MPKAFYVSDGDPEPVDIEQAGLRRGTPADLIEVIESEGGKAKQAFVLLGRTRIDVEGFGRWLVLRLPNE